ncbi:MAG: 4Fe-4S dicluster domain-containing protein [Thermoanaerobaculia bacterium]
MSSLRGWLDSLRGPEALRPPGARPEPEFGALCIRCNRCIAVCPYKSLKPAGWNHRADSGTPVLVAREIPCYLCMICPPACPTGALDPITDKRAVRMGTAVVNEQTCYAFLSILCRSCVDECPLGEAAITQTSDLTPIVKDACVGCGICEKVCPMSEPAIVIRRKA